MISRRFFFFFSLFVCFGLVILPSHAQHDINTPDGLIRVIVDDVMKSVNADPSMQAGDIKKIQQLVKKKILPYTDFEKTTALAMGPNWKQATPQQKDQIVKEFEQLLIRTYAGAIAQIRDQKIQFGRVRESDDKAIVPTTVLHNGEKLQMHYRLEKVNGTWKVYDMNVLGVWLVEVYKTQFKEQVAKNGIDGLIQFLETRNQNLSKQ